MGKGKQIDMILQDDSFSRNVFINCPFDREYIPILRPLLFTVLYLGYLPRITSESSDSLQQRIHKIRDLIEVSKFSVHDLSRIKSQKSGDFYRLNMAFELGIDYGCRLFKEGAARNKRCLILAEERYQYRRALSDLSGVDIKKHSNEPEEVVRQTRNWFVENNPSKAHSGTRI